MLSSTLRAAVALALAFEVTLATAKAETIECRAKPETREYWSWREIDGRRCWYKGHRRISKELLSWGPKTPAEAVKPAEAKPAEAVKPAEAIELDTTTARTAPQMSSGKQSSAPRERVEVSEHPDAGVGPLGPFEIAWRNTMADLKFQDRVKTIRTIAVRPTNAN
ncbi:MAG: hypothetical protein WAM17_19475 [Rhodoplanes sp.]